MLRKIGAESSLAYVFLAFIAMAGLSYINFLPGVVNALAGGLGFSDAEAGRVVALNGYGGIAGTMGAVFLVRRVDWRQVLLPALVVLAIIDVATVNIDDYRGMLGWRFLAGMVGGLCVGIALSVLARLNNPDRAFGLLLFLQFSVGSLVIYTLPSFELALGTHAVFCLMAALVFLSLVFLSFLPPRADNSRLINQPVNWTVNTLLLMLAVLAYQIAASAIWAYVGLVGLDAGIAADDVSMYIAITGMLGLVSAMVPVVCGKRWRLYWVLSGTGLSAIAALLLNDPVSAPLYVVAMALLFSSWPAVQSFLLAVTADMDSTGQLSTVAGVVSSVGLASGPLLASSLLDSGNFSPMLYTCALIFTSCLVLLFKPVQAQEESRENPIPFTTEMQRVAEQAIAHCKKIGLFTSDLVRTAKERKMIRYIFNSMLLAMQRRYDYDVQYMQDILKTDLKAFLKFQGFQLMSAHAGSLPAGPLFAARIRAIIWDDCGPCTQLVVNMALEAKLSPDMVRAIIDGNLNSLPDDIALVVRFTELVLAHHPEADDLREKILSRWGAEGLIAIAYGISSSRVYPTLKYTLGYGKACSRISVDGTSLAPNRQPVLVMGADNA